MSLLEQFRFVDPGVLTDGELELVTPEERWVDALMMTLAHPLTREHAPQDAAITREQVIQFVRDHPLGRQTGDAEKGLVPAYYFWMCARAPSASSGQARSASSGQVIVGGIGLRVGHTRNLEMYMGHIGYTVHPPARGNGYAQRAVRLLLPLARRLGIKPLWITCNPENVASRRTCESAGGRLIETVNLPEDHPAYSRGERRKCRYRFDV
jgi:predicted acetyltransferase